MGELARESYRGDALYRCENCNRIAPLMELQGDCRPGWTHGPLIAVAEWNDYHELAALRAAVDHLGKVDERTARRVLNYLEDRFIVQPVRDRQRLEVAGMRLAAAFRRLRREGFGGRLA